MWELYAQIIDGRQESARVEKRFRRRDGTLVWTDLSASLIRDATGKPEFTVAMVEDVTTRHELQDRLRHQALHDTLTRLANRALLLERLTALLARARGRVGLCYLDLDRFKAVNDRLGHHAGDALLVAVAARLDAVMSAHGHLVARMGGDEFVVLVEDPSADELACLADTLLGVLAEPVPVGEHLLRVSASIGVVERPVVDTTAGDLLKDADMTLYWAKSEGRNRWSRFDPERNAREMTRHLLADTLPAGLDRGEFRLLYQPIVSLSDGHARGVEALVRWAHPTAGLLEPTQFIEIAEETGAIVALGRFVLNEACEQVAEWNAVHPDGALFVSVNLAVRQAHEPDLVDDVAHVLDKTGLAAHRLQLEITESALLGPVGRPAATLRHLGAAGVRLAVDDFGTGYSNLGYLTRLPLHSLKLAGDLIDGLQSETAAEHAVVTSVISLAHAIGLTVTAEGVETLEQAEKLRAAGCDTVQGWLYAPPAKWAALAPRFGRPFGPQG